MDDLSHYCSDLRNWRLYVAESQVLPRLRESIPEFGQIRSEDGRETADSVV
jgi:hypothetical protein